MNVCTVLSNHNIVVDDPLIDEFISICTKYKFYKDALIDIYPVCAEDKKELIQDGILSEFNKISVFSIYVALEHRIIIYDEKVEKHLIMLCEAHITHQKVDDSGSWDRLYMLFCA